MMQPPTLAEEVEIGILQGLAMVPSDVVIASGTETSVGKEGEKDGGS